MKISDLLKMGLRNLFRRKARTALTVIGMVIGTISIVVMGSIGIGIRNVFTEAVMKDGGLSRIYVTQSWSYDESTGMETKSAQIDDKLIEKIKQIEHVKYISPQFNVNLRLKNGDYEAYLYVEVIDYAAASDFGYPPLEDGRQLTKDDYRKIIVSKDRLNYFYKFSGRIPKTKQVNLKKDKVTVEFQDFMPPEGKKPFSFSLNDNVGFFAAEENTEYAYTSYIDIDNFKELYKKYASTLKTEDRKRALKKLKTYDYLYVNVEDIRQVMDVVEEIKKLGVTAYSAMEELDPMINTANMLQMVFGAIGAIAMLVSAINIANTMVMSIYERTKEIGIMKVLGCLIKDIKKLFLFEAGLIGLIGGTIGIGLSYIASWAVNKYGGPLLSAIMPGNGWFVDSTGAKFSQIPIWLPFLAALFSIVVGVIAGYIPARRATKISAIEAMKTEG
ncbi:MAG: FtsX-like permease family protein [Clostridiales bacterium]|nr:FtsX-like permease family protein [Clostridiales bacterium]